MASFAAALLSVPLLVLMFQERDTGQRSRFEYLALLAAREEMYDARFLAACGATPKPLLEHSWRPQRGGLLARLGPAAASVKSGLEYRPLQSRIETSLSLESGTGRLRRATVLARWEDPDTKRAGDTRPDTVRLVIGLLWPGHGAAPPP